MALRYESNSTWHFVQLIVGKQIMPHKHLDDLLHSHIEKKFVLEFLSLFGHQIELVVQHFIWSMDGWQINNLMKMNFNGFNIARLELVDSDIIPIF